MKHYVVEITFTVDVDKIGEVTDSHRKFLSEGYEQGWLLMSGPMVPRTGGIIVARSSSVDSLRDYFRRDPYAVKGMARYRFTEFKPVKHQPWLGTWTNASED